MALVVLYHCGPGSLLGVVIVFIFFVLFLPLAGKGFPGLWAWAWCPFGGPLLLVCALLFGVFPPLLDDLIL